MEVREHAADVTSSRGPYAANDLGKPSAADAFQIRSVSQTRLVSRLGRVSTADLEAIVRAVRVVVGAS